jgi:protein-S-isoprenylcysteine O-methyltransferase Ste14
MYVGVLAVIVAESLLFENRGIAFEVAWVWLGVQLFVRFYEEPRLTRTFPEEFERYRQHVRRWLPRLTPWIA